MPRRASGTTLPVHTRAQSASTVSKGTSLWRGQQVSGNIDLRITGPGQVSLLYQPLGTGTWGDVPLDPIAQSAFYSFAAECGKVPDNMLFHTGRMAGGNGTQSLTTQAAGTTPGLTPQKRASQAAAEARTRKARESKIIDQSKSP